jgi:hypothetical protein
VGETAINKIPYPKDTDAPDGPTQIKALAELLDTLKWGYRNLKVPVGVLPMTAESLSLTESYQDITGAKLEIEPLKTVKLLVAATFEMACVEADAAMRGAIKVDSESERERVARFQGPLNARATVALVDMITLAEGAHTIKLRAKRDSAKAGNVVKLGTQLAYLYVVS